MKRKSSSLALVAAFCLFHSAKIGAQCTYPPPQAQGASINCGQTATLTALGSGPSIVWYDQPTGGSPVGIGSSFTTPVLTATTTYYVETSDLNYGFQTFTATGGQQFFVVPPGVTSISVDMAGAQGQNSTYSDGGKGGRVQAEINVTPGETLYVYVGSQASFAQSGTTLLGGYNGGGQVLGNGGTITAYMRAGGGASDIRKGGSNITDRILVAGGGGGAGYNSSNICHGGDGGGLTGANGLYNGSFNSTYCGQGGTQSAGGAYGTNSSNATSGSFFNGGNGYSGSPTSYSGGGGGGGWYGGGGGANYGGGGGGSSYADPTYVTNVTHTQGYQLGDGYVTISYSSSSCSSTRIPVVVNVNSTVLLPQVQGIQVFCGSNATLTATGSTGKFQWFTSPYATTPVDTGSTIDLGNVFGTMTMYVRAVDNYTTPLCISQMVAVMVTTQELLVPNTPSVVNVACGASASITASGSSNQYFWYDQATGGKPISSNPTFTTSNLFSDTTYYWVEAVSDTTVFDSLVFNYTGGVQYYTVPAGVTEIEVDLYGAQGGSALYANGGLGGRVKATIPVTPGQTLNLYVGQQPTNYTGGWNGGGSTTSYTNGRGGGGATDIRINGTALTNRIIVAGGGGGAGYSSSNTFPTGGAGGGLTALNGGYSNSSFIGYGGSQTSGGASNYSSSYNGSLGQGGNAYGYSNTYVAGGGGGGYYGGAGGYSNSSSSAGGGGGSSFTYAQATNILHEQGVNTGNGKIVIKIAKQYCASVRKKVAVVTNPIPVPTAIDAAIYCGDDATLQVSGSNGMYLWFADPNGEPIAQGSSYTIPRLKGDTTLYVAAVSDTSSPQIFNFNFTGSVQTWTVPAGVTEIEVEMAGAQGGSNTNSQGGYGAIIKGKMAVTPGQVLNLYVGQQPTSYTAAWPNGGSGGTSGSWGRAGGGSTDIRIGGTALTNRVMVAGAGGGAAYSCSSTNAQKGGDAGLNGSAENGEYCDGFNTTYCGYGATQTGGGSSTNGTSGTLGQGGNGPYYYAGGGGGGYYGGGGGYDYGSGGGGSSWMDPTLVTDPQYVSATNTGNGYIKIKTVTNYCASVKIPVKAVVTPIPGPTVTPVTAINCGDVTTLSVNSSSPIVEWYNTPTGGTPFAYGTTINTAPIYQTDTFWVESKSWQKVSSSETFNFTGGLQTWTVPTGITEIEVEVAGAQGGSNSYSRGGFGAVVKSKIAVTPGQVINLYVGEQPTGISAGWPNGGAGYSNSTYSRAGGGSSDVRIGGTNTSDIVVIAGAGGGASYNGTTTDYYRGGNAGLNGTAENGFYNGSNTNTTYCGFGATQTSGGNAGNGYSTPYKGDFFKGGNGYASSYYPGGGGGGWYGGGGGYYYGGGGGGSSWIDPAKTLTQEYVSVTNTGHGYIKINYTTEDPCVSPRVPYVVTVNPIAPTVVTQGDTTFCGSGNATFAVQPVPNATYYWIDSNNNLVGSNSSYNTGNQTTTNSYTVYYQLNGCNSAPETVTSVINPNPVVGIVDPGTLCTDLGTIQLQAAATNGTWSGTGILNSATGTFDVANNLGTNKVYLSVVDANTTCSSIDSVSFQVVASPDASITSTSQTVCITTPAFQITSANAGGTWSGTGLNAATAMFDPATAGIGTHTIYYSMTNTPCTDIDSITIEVAPIPSAAITAPTAVCETSSPITLSGATAGGTWSGIGITNSINGTFDPSVVNAANTTIYYSVTLGSCTDQQSVVINIDPEVVPTITNGNTISLCEGAAPLQLNANPTGGSWIGTGVSSTGLFTPTNLGAGSQDIVYSYTSGACTSTDTINVVINTIPDAVFSASNYSFCESVSSVPLNATNVGGLWSGPGIANGSIGNFNPSLAGLGTHTVTYSLTVNGCTDTHSETFTVTTAPQVEILSGVNQVCVNSPSFTLVGYPSGGTWSGSGILNPTNGTISPVMAGVGTHQIVYSFNPSGGCGNTDTINITVGSIPQANFSATDACLGESVSFTDLSLEQYSAINSWYWNLGDGTSATTQNPIHTYNQTGNYIVTLTVNNSEGCSNTISKNITVNSIPSAAWTYNHIGTNSAKLNVTSPVVGANYLWDLGDGNISTVISPNHNYGATGVYTVCLTVEKNGCSAIECHDVEAQSFTGIEESVSITSTPEVFPNPFINNFNIRLNLTDMSDVQYKLYDMTGRVIMLENVNSLTPGSHTIQVQTPSYGLTSGFYNLEVLVNGVAYNSILIKQ